MWTRLPGATSSPGLSFGLHHGQSCQQAAAWAVPGARSHWASEALRREGGCLGRLVWG